MIELGMIIAVGAGIVAHFFRAHRAARARTWREVATRAQLTNVAAHQNWAGVASSLSGRRGPFSVRLEGYEGSQSDPGTRIVISGLGYGAGDLAFRYKGLASRPGKAFGPRITLGDPAFDSVVYVQGSPELVRALLDAESRRGVMRLVTPPYTATTRRMLSPPTRAWLADGELRVEVSGSQFDAMGPGSDLMEISLVLTDALRVAERLVRPRDLVARLAENLREEPLADVRLGILRTLLERHQGHPLVDAALGAALKDADDGVRLEAAMALGAGGRDTLLEIAASEGPDDPLAARAVSALGSHLPLEPAQAILTRALRLRRAATARACLESLGQRPGPDAFALLAKVLAVEKGDLAAVAARALASSAGSAAEDTLLQALEGHEPEALSGVAEALGRVGTAAAVMPLRDAAARIADDTFRRVARQAVAEIQARLQGATPGQLSLASGESGQVALVDDDARGSVSLTDEAKTAAPPERPR